MIRIIESPREAMQGLQQQIPTEAKVKYIDSLLQAGFDTVETGSYVSPKLIPQMADSLDVLAKLDTRNTKSNIMFLAVSTKGADVIANSEVVTHISYPFSISPAFLRKNLNTDTAGSLDTVSHIAEICRKTGKFPVIYIFHWHLATISEIPGALKFWRKELFNYMKGESGRFPFQMFP
jgi:hydroxymethylglutaryl-CoA lyase